MCQNIALSILWGAAFCKGRHMGFACFTECPRKGSHVQPLAAVIDKVSAAMATDQENVPVAE